MDGDAIVTAHNETNKARLAISRAFVPAPSSSRVSMFDPVFQQHRLPAQAAQVQFAHAGVGPGTCKRDFAALASDARGLQLADVSLLISMSNYVGDMQLMLYNMGRTFSVS